MAGAPYTVNLSLTDDETFSFTVFLTAQGYSIPWPDYRPEYAIRRPCGSSITFDMDSGIAVDPFINKITVLLPELRLQPGVYHHGMRLNFLPNNGYIQLFDGDFTITEGNFTKVFP